MSRAYDLAAGFWQNLQFNDSDKLAALFIAALLLVTWLVCLFFWFKWRPSRTFGSRYPLIGTIKFWVFLIAMYGLLVVAWAWPFLSAGSTVVRRGPVEVVFLVDYSLSMFLKGIGEYHIDIAKREIQNLVATRVLKEGDRASLIIFGRQAFTQIPLTTELNGAFFRRVNKLGRPGSLKGNDLVGASSPVPAFRRAYRSLDNQDKFAIYGRKAKDVEGWLPEKKSNRLIIFLSDGDLFNYEDNTPNEAKQLDSKLLEEAFAELRTRGLDVYVVGIGTRNGEPLLNLLDGYRLEDDYYSGLVQDLSGITSRLDIGTLEYIARSNNGRTFLIENANTSATGFLKETIEAHRSSVLETVPVDEQQDVWRYFILAAMVILLLGIIFY